MSGRCFQLTLESGDLSRSGSSPQPIRFTVKDEDPINLSAFGFGIDFLNSQSTPDGCLTCPRIPDEPDLRKTVGNIFRISARSGSLSVRMNENLTDFGLLRDFIRNGDQGAFAAVVRRHLDLVYGTAMRKVEDHSGAEEVSQNVFATLARKAWQFAPDDSLPAWLHRTALLEAKTWLRGELRRRRREQSAAELGTTMKTCEEEPVLRSLVPLLDGALLSLREKDRAALLLRFYEGQSLREVGETLGVGEQAAHKRIAAALERLTHFFQQRGFRTTTTALALAALQQSASPAPAAVAASIIGAAGQAAPPSLFGLSALLARFTGLTKAQSAAVCVVIVAAPVAWQWNLARASIKESVSMQLRLGGMQAEQEQLLSETARQRANSAQLSGAIAQASRAQLNSARIAGQWESFAARIRGLLNDPNHRWQDDLPYARIPKSVIKKLDLMGLFQQSGKISETAMELLALTPEEQRPTERALANYWTGVYNLMSREAYETNAAAPKPGRLAKTVIVPPLGSDMKKLAEETGQQIVDQLGEERENILFGGWDKGAIQTFWPGNLWNIAEDAQNFTVWIDPNAATTNGINYGASWNTKLGGTSSEGAWSLGEIPVPIYNRFFQTWLGQFGIARQ